MKPIAAGPSAMAVSAWLGAKPEGVSRKLSGASRVAKFMFCPDMIRVGFGRPPVERHGPAVRWSVAPKLLTTAWRVA